MAWEPVPILYPTFLKSKVLFSLKTLFTTAITCCLTFVLHSFLFQTPKSSSSWDFGELNGRRNWFREFEFLFPTSCFAIKIQGLNDGDNDSRRGRKCVGLKKDICCLYVPIFYGRLVSSYFLPILETETGKHFEVSSFVDTCQVAKIEN